MKSRLLRHVAPAFTAFVVVAMLALTAVSPALSQPFTSAQRLTEQDGEAIYKNVCQGCHMPDARGAVGAGAYPALAGNAKLSSAGYPAEIVVAGQGGMPPFGKLLTDDQIVAVVGYVRTHFGNDYADKLTPDDVKAMRQ